MYDTTPSRDFRPEIQGLRAVAVLLVVAYHLYPNRVSGGFIGVDVFFVLSGYLITSHLVREAVATSRLSLSRFWERRIRRLLPASLLVLAASTLVTLVWIPRTLWDQTLHHILMSVLYVENWALAADAIDYSARDNEPTLVQHYWSLSVEEQFYVVWPLLVLAAVLVVQRRPRLRLVPVLVGVLGGLTAASFGYSIVATADEGASAYFVTPTRAWEFGVGSLVALLATGPSSWWSTRSGLRLALGWLGLLAVAGSGFALAGDTPFPGWVAAVPVLGTATLLLAGDDPARLAVARLLSLRPMTFLGDISYSVYLWHWPLIVVLPFITGVDLRTGDKAGIFCATVLLGLASTRWVENPVRSYRPQPRSRWRVYAAGVTGMGVVVAATGLMRADYDQDLLAAQAAADQVVGDALAGVTPCLGPAVFDDLEACGPVPGDGTPPLDPEAIAHQNVESTFPDCMSSLDDPAVLSCELGDRQEHRRTVAVLGDSHATAWFSAFDELGKERGWGVVTYTRASCPFTDAERTLADEPAGWAAICRDHNTEVERRVVDDPDIDTVFVTAYSSAYGWAQGPGTSFDDPATDGFKAVWKRLVGAGKQVVVLRDVPAVKDRIETPICLGRNGLDPLACANSRTDGLPDDVEAEAAEQAPDGVHLVDLTDRFCDKELCHAVIGDVIVYRDGSHLSHEYSSLLAPYLGMAFDAVDAHAAR